MFACQHSLISTKQSTAETDSNVIRLTINQCSQGVEVPSIRMVALEEKYSGLSPKKLGCMRWTPRISVLNFMAIHEIVEVIV